MVLVWEDQKAAWDPQPICVSINMNHPPGEKMEGMEEEPWIEKKRWVQSNDV
jgi:hypothetical protein